MCCPGLVCAGGICVTASTTTTAAPTVPPMTQPPTRQPPPTQPALAATQRLASALAGLHVTAHTCPAGFRATAAAGFARSCRAPVRLGDLDLRVTDPTGGAATGTPGGSGDLRFPALPVGAVTLATAPPPTPSTVYAFCGADLAAPTI